MKTFFHNEDQDFVDEFDHFGLDLILTGSTVLSQKSHYPAKSQDGIVKVQETAKFLETDSLYTPGQEVAAQILHGTCVCVWIVEAHKLQQVLRQSNWVGTEVSQAVLLVLSSQMKDHVILINPNYRNSDFIKTGQK